MNNYKKNLRWRY